MLDWWGHANLAADTLKGLIMVKQDSRGLRKAQKAIIDAFITLVKKKGFLKVTVQDILDKAQVNKSTFYMYYLDKYDLLDKVEDQLLAGLREIEDDVPFDLVIKSGISEDTLEPTERFLRYMYDNGELFALFTNDEYCSAKFVSKHRESTMTLWKDKDVSNKFAVPQIYAVAALIGMANSLIFEWVKNGFRETPEDFLVIYRKIVGTVLKSVFI